MFFYKKSTGQTDTIQMPFRSLLIMPCAMSLLGNKFHVHACICVTDFTSFQVPLTFRQGNRYRVTVRGLRQRSTSIAMTSDAAVDDAETTTFDVLFKGSTEFRTGEGQCKKSL